LELHVLGLDDDGWLVLDGLGEGDVVGTDDERERVVILALSRGGAVERGDAQSALEGIEFAAGGGPRGISRP
jgi:hypothetical protein